MTFSAFVIFVLGCNQQSPEQNISKEEWPDTVSFDAPNLSIVFEGNTVFDGDTLEITGQAAGRRASQKIFLTLYNHGSEDISFSNNSQDWLNSSAIELVAAPESIEPQTQKRITLEQSSFTLHEQMYEDLLTIPLTNPIELHLKITIPSAERMLLAGNNHYLLISNSYGDDFAHEEIRATHDLLGLFSIDQAFIKIGTDDTNVLTIEKSNDGIVWDSLDMVNQTPATSCTKQWERIICLTENGFLLSTEEGFSHIERNHTLIKLDAVKDKLYAVDSDGNSYIVQPDLSTQDLNIGSAAHLIDVAANDEQWMAVAKGTDPVLLNSEDGVNWSESDWPFGNIDIQKIEYNGEVWVAQSTPSQSQAGIYTSAEGEIWTHKADFDLVGICDGHIYALEHLDYPKLYRSSTGESWELLHILPGQASIKSIVLGAITP